jgi:predicted O-methyltransferase YrrM
VYERRALRQRSVAAEAYGEVSALKRSLLFRVSAALAFVARSSVRSPGAGLAFARSVGSVALDRHFDAASGLPYLDSSVARRVLRFPVTIPSPGLMSSANQNLDGLVWLVSLARLVEARLAFEIGTFNGFTALTLATNLPEAEIHTLDIPTDSEASLRMTDSDRGHIETRRLQAQRVYEGTTAERNITQHLEDSATFDFGRFRSRCDLVYVDGAHSFEYVERDTRTALSIVSPQGVIVWDDYQRHEPGVVSYLESSGLDGLVRLPGTRLVARMSDASRLHRPDSSP